MTNLQAKLVAVCQILGLVIELDVPVILPSGHTLHPEARIAHLGSALGMLVFRDGQYDYDLIRTLCDTEYGFTQLTPPSDPTEYDLEVCIEMFSEWGWAGDPDKRPAWMSECPDNDAAEEEESGQ